MISCAILDDEDHALQVLSQYVNKSEMLALAAATTNTVAVLNLAVSGKIDLLFLDINMPEISGIEVAKSIGSHCKIIFTTAYPDFALDGFELGVIDYLLKPISYTRFLKAVMKAAAMQDNFHSAGAHQSGFFYVKAGVRNTAVKINFDDISYIEARLNYVSIYHEGKKTLVYSSLKEVESALPQGRFIRVHKSFIVSLAHLLRIEGNSLYLNDMAAPITIGENYRQTVWELIRQHTLGEGLK